MTIEDAIQKIEESHADSLAEHGAYDMIAGQNFVGYLKDGDACIECEVWSWGVKQPLLRAATEDEVVKQAFRIYDNH